MNSLGVPPLFPVWTTVRQMLRDRGYIVPADPSLEEYISDFGSPENRDLMSLAVVHSINRSTQQLRVLFVSIEKVGKAELEQILKRLGDTSTRAILILPSSASVTSAAKSIVANLVEPVQVEIFFERELSINIIRNNSDLTYQVLYTKGTEQLRVMNKYGRIPFIGIDDMTARYFGLRYGDILKTSRKSESAGRYATYKICKYVEEMPKETGTKKRKV
jgi:DNA-directed RNA polymerase I, II, and III subunit RPABC1